MPNDIPKFTTADFEIKWDPQSKSVFRDKIYRKGRAKALRCYGWEDMPVYPVHILPVTPELEELILSHVDDAEIAIKLDEKPDLIYKIINELISRATQPQNLIDELNYLDVQELKQIIK